MRYLDPRSDLVFRRIFGEHKTLCISLLNALLPLPADGQILDLEYCDPTMFPMTQNEKNSIVDVSCRDSRGRQFLVEMQMIWSESFMPRTLLNGAKAYVRQSQKGMDYTDLQPVYSLCIINDVFLKESEYAETFRHVYTIRHSEFPELSIEGMAFVFVELPKFRSVNRAHNRMAELWLKFLNEIGDKQDEELDPNLTENPLIRQAIDIVAVSSFSENEIATYEAEWDKVSVRISTLKDAERRGEAIGLQRGEAIGLEKGEAIGLEKGEAIGLEKGEAIGLEKGEAIGLEKGEAIGLEKGEAIGLEKGEAIGLEKGEAIGLEKGEAIGLEKGEAIGLEKGEAIGLEKGEAIGLEKGEAIGLEKGKREMARILRDCNTPIDIIVAASGLTPEEISQL